MKARKATDFESREALAMLVVLGRLRTARLLFLRERLGGGNEWTSKTQGVASVFHGQGDRSQNTLLDSGFLLPNNLGRRNGQKKQQVMRGLTGKLG